MNSRLLISAVEDVLQQGRTMLATLPEEFYTRKLDGPPGSSLGAHYRHVLDHFLCLFEGVQTGEINYDHRRRSPALENSVAAAMTATDHLLQSFHDLPAEVWGRPCHVLYSVGYGDAETQSVPSNLAREVMFCVGHAIHHFAVVKLVCAAMSVVLPYEFGVAPSTLKHLAAQSAH